MASKVQITGGGFQDIAGNPLSEGYLTFVLSQDAQVNGDEIAAGFLLQINLDSNGNIAGAPTLWPNDVLSPSNTFYTVTAYSADGQLVWGPNTQQVLSSPSPFDIGVWVPGTVNIQPVDTGLTTVDVAFGPTTAGDMTVVHDLGVVPAAVTVEMTSSGQVWFQNARYDNTNVYIVASESGLTGHLKVWVWS